MKKLLLLFIVMIIQRAGADDIGDMFKAKPRMFVRRISIYAITITEQQIVFVQGLTVRPILYEVKYSPTSKVEVTMDAETVPWARLHFDASLLGKPQLDDLRKVEIHLRGDEPRVPETLAAFTNVYNLSFSNLCELAETNKYNLR